MNSYYKYPYLKHFLYYQLFWFFQETKSVSCIYLMFLICFKISFIQDYITKDYKGIMKSKKVFFHNLLKMIHEVFEFY